MTWNRQVCVFHRLRRKIVVGLEVFRFMGPGPFFLKVLPWLLRRRYFFYSQPLDPLTTVEDPCPVMLKQAHEEDLPRLAAFRRGVYSLPQLKQRLKDGHLCFIGWIGHRPVQVRWVFVGSPYVPYLKRTLDLSPAEVYVDEAFTAPDLRNKGIGTCTGRLLRRALSELGYRRYTSAAASWNTTQQRLADKFGMGKVGEGGCGGFLPGRKSFWRGNIEDCGDGRIKIHAVD